MEKVCRWIPFVFWEICLSDEKCGYEVVYWESFAEIKKRQFLVSGLERKGVLSLCSMLSGIKKGSLRLSGESRFYLQEEV
ncbi:hypothetical protein, partial [Vibrio parahaemolyticus]|uniref:hypothetical protein n=1 Tax=Vibrio parahaemolyticus TaxID=670 RepID=UPI0035315F94